MRHVDNMYYFEIEMYKLKIYDGHNSSAALVKDAEYYFNHLSFSPSGPEK